MSKTANPLQSVAAWWQAAPFTAVFAVFFIVPLALVLMVSFWQLQRLRAAARLHLQELHQHL
jgi:ABC-type sugar transport system permease subunit